MENAADALKMAGAILIFVLAISVIIFSFGQARENADIILEYKDRETTYIEGQYYYVTTGTEREVSLETIIPAIFRAYLERYKIILEGLEKPIYKIKNSEGNYIEKYTIDFETAKNAKYPNATVGKEQVAEYLKGIIYGDYNETYIKFQEKFNISLEGCESLYEQLKNKAHIKEYLGVYYQNDNPNVPDINKTEKRIITYKINS